MYRHPDGEFLTTPQLIKFKHTLFVYECPIGLTPRVSAHGAFEHPFNPGCVHVAEDKTRLKLCPVGKSVSSRFVAVQPDRGQCCITLPGVVQVWRITTGITLKLCGIRCKTVVLEKLQLLHVIVLKPVAIHVAGVSFVVVLVCLHTPELAHAVTGSMVSAMKIAVKIAVILFNFIVKTSSYILS
jgi:hypothetical protein